MALFSKPQAKKPAGKPAGNSRMRVKGARPSAKAAVGAANARTRLGDKLTLVELRKPSAAFEVGGSSQLCAVLENAALLHASGHSAAALASLYEGVHSDPDASASHLAWLSLLDLLQRTGDRAGFDRTALEYVVRFERSAPAWRDAGNEPPVAQRSAMSSTYAAPRGQMTAANASQVVGWSRLKADGSTPPRVDLGRITGFDAAGARLLSDALAGLRRRQMPVTIENAPGLRAMVEAELARGRDAGEGPWLLLLELLQWHGEQATFDDRAIEFAVTFEVSPPSWEPPVTAAGREEPASGADNEPMPDPESTLAWSGAMTGAGAEQLTSLFEFAQPRSRVLVDMQDVERIEFVTAGAVLNAINRLEASGKEVRIVRASPILQALLFLLGVSPQQFAGKVA